MPLKPNQASIKHFVPQVEGTHSPKQRSLWVNLKGADHGVYIDNKAQVRANPKAITTIDLEFKGGTY
jgi:hypothetical protein